MRNDLTQMLFILASLLIFIALIVIFSIQLANIFMTSPYFNGFIVIVISIGLGYIFQQLLHLYRDKKWLESYLKGIILPRTPHHLRGIENISFFTKGDFLDYLHDSLMLPHTWTRYCMGILILLGLLGTFWGLSTTIVGITKIIGQMSSIDVLDNLKTQLQEPLAGMGTAFSSSLFGLIGSLMVGFYDVIYQNMSEKLYLKLEFALQKLSRPTEYSGDSYNAQLLELTIEKLSQLEKTLAKMTKDLMTHVVHSSEIIQRDMLNTQKEIQDLIGQIESNPEALRKALDKIAVQQKQEREWMTQEMKEEIRIIAKILSKLIAQ